MSEERRVVSRHDPIIVEADDVSVEIRPVPWRQRNQLGTCIAQSYTNALNESLATNRDEAGNFTFDARPFESFFDYEAVLTMALPGVSKTEIDKLDFDGILTVLDAVLEVNRLERMAHMLDPDRRSAPNFQPPPAEEGTSDDGPKTESSSDS